MAATAATLMLVAACSRDDSEPQVPGSADDSRSHVAEPSGDPSWEEEVDDLKDAIFREISPCETDEDISRRAQRLGVVVVDGRCDRNPEAPVGLYDMPRQTAPGTAPERAVSGDVYRAGEVVVGQPVGNDAWASPNWYEVETADGIRYIPAAWGQGAATLPEYAP